MEINHILQSDYLDLLFDNRNKQYGSYELRKHYNDRARQALGMVLLAVTAAVAGPYLYSRTFPAREAAPLMAAPNERMVKVETVTYEPPKAKTAPPQVKAPVDRPNPSVAKTDAFTQPKVVSNSAVTKPVLPTRSITDEVGPVSNRGNGGLHAATNTNVPVGPPGGTTVPKTETELPVSGPVKVANVMPEYPGGMAALLAYLRQNIQYPADARAEEKQGKVIVRFVVNEMGAIEDIQVVKSLFASCDKEAIRVVKAMKPWKPGMAGGKAVKVYYSLPITFVLQ